MAHGLRKRDAIGLGEGVELGNAAVAHPSLGHVEHPLDGNLIGRVHHCPQVRHGVLDLAPVVEACTADHLVRDAEAHERLFEHPALRVGAVEGGHLLPHHVSVALQVLHRASHEGGLVAFVLGVVAHDAVATTLLAPEVLLLAIGVVADDGVGRIEDGLRAAIVLVEHDGGDVVERLLELQDVAHVGPAPAVHAVVDQHSVGDVVVGGLDLQVIHGAVVLLDLDGVDHPQLVAATDEDQHRHTGLQVRQRLLRARAVDGHDVPRRSRQHDVTGDKPHDTTRVATSVNTADHAQFVDAAVAGTVDLVVDANSLDRYGAARRADEGAGQEALVAVADDGDLAALGGE